MSSANPEQPNLNAEQPVLNAVTNQQHFDSPSTSRAALESTPLSPEVIRPFPKITKSKKSKRKLKKSSILTDSPDHEPTIGLSLTSDETQIQEAAQSSTGGQEVTSSVSFQPKNPEVGDYVLVQFDTRRSPIHYVGLVQRQNGTEFAVKFFRRSQRHAPDYAFVEPMSTDIGDVDLSSLKGVLPSALPHETSTKRLKDILQFAFVFDNFNMQ